MYIYIYEYIPCHHMFHQRCPVSLGKRWPNWQAKWIKDKLDGNIPQGLTEAVIVKYADTSGTQRKGWGRGWGH